MRYLNEPDAAIKTSTNKTPIAMREEVRRVLLLYLIKLRTAILKSLSMAVFLSVCVVDKLPVFQGKKRFHCAYDLWVSDPSCPLFPEVM
jgi:hypothetical protein